MHPASRYVIELHVALGAALAGMAHSAAHSRKPDACSMRTRAAASPIVEAIPNTPLGSEPNMSPLHFVIRQAEPSDATAISGLVTGLAHYFVSDPSSELAEPFMAGLRPAAYAERIGSPDFHHYLAEDSEGPCGIIALRGQSRIHHLFVRKSAHRRGVARALWGYAKARSTASLFTVNSSVFAVPVYERFGFTAKGSPRTASGLVFVPMECASGG